MTSEPSDIEVPASSPVPPWISRMRATIRRIVFNRTFWIVLSLPTLYLFAQVWHRVADGLGSQPVRSVRTIADSVPPPSVDTRDFLLALGALTESRFDHGHRVELLLDGPSALAQMEADIRSAQQSVMVQSYSCSAGQVMDKLRDMLASKAREGVIVYFLADGFGCRGLSPEFRAHLGAAGVRAATMRPVRWFTMHRAMHRSHVRSVIVDGRVAYTGGFGFSDKWIPGIDGPAWHETTARFTGPAVAQLTGAFAISWADATGDLLTGTGIFPASSSADSGATAAIMFTTRTYGTPVPERYLALSIASARRTIYIANPYFIPNRELRGWLTDAARRGVDVRVLTASDNIDVQFTHWAARSTYDELLRAGVRIAEYTPSMLHAKTMVIDGVFSSVGSLNLDNISLRINDEAVLLVQDSIVGAVLDSSFLADLRQSDEITFESFRKRSLVAKFMTSVAVLVRNFL